MALPPHALDGVFRNPETFEGEFMESSRVRAAFANARSAFLDTQKNMEENPGLVGPGPEQAARSAFLKTLND